MTGVTDFIMDNIYVLVIFIILIGLFLFFIVVISSDAINLVIK